MVHNLIYTHGVIYYPNTTVLWFCLTSFPSVVRFWYPLHQYNPSLHPLLDILNSCFFRESCFETGSRTAQAVSLEFA